MELTKKTKLHINQTEVRKILQNPGTRMEGLVEGPDLRKSADWGKPWLDGLFVPLKGLIGPF